MSHEYSKIGKEIRNTGLFSEYLPPCFKLDHRVFCWPPEESCDLIPPYCFTMSRFNGKQARRNIYIPEIGSYVVTHTFIKNSNILKELIEFTESNSQSFSPILGEDDTIMKHEQSYDIVDIQVETSEMSIYIKNIIKKIEKGVGAKQILKLDISNCFGSFYSHMIPVIMLGVDRAEEEYSKSLRQQPTDPIYTKYFKLDNINRKQNLNRTNGLLVGPLFSRIIAEALLTRIDIELMEEEIVFARYVDDYEIFLYELGEEQRIINIFVRILKKYGFSLNDEKTEIVDFPYYVTKNLEKIIAAYQKNDYLVSEELMELFNKFFELESSGTKGAVRFLLKSIEKNPLSIKNYDLYRAYLLSILNNDDRSLTKVCSLLIEDIKQKPLEEDNINLINCLIIQHIELGHDLEVIWLLYLLIEGNVEIADEIIDEIVGCNNELAQLMLFRKNKMNQDQKIEVKRRSKSWILLYELYVSNIISIEDLTIKLCLNKNIEMYSKMKSKDIHFCY